MKRLRVPTAIFMLWFWAAGAGWIAAQGAEGVSPEDVARVTTNIVCTCGSDGCPPTHLVRHCSCAQAQTMQREVASMLAAGRTDEEIYAYYIQKYGKEVMSSPDAEGFNLLGWVLPFAALFVGGAVVALAYRKLRTQAPAPAAAGRAAEIDDKYRELLQRELSE